MTIMESMDNTKRPLPDGWRWIRLGEILSALESGSRPKGGAVGVESGVPSISAEQMTIHGTFDFAIKRFVPREFYEQMTRGHIQQGDILIVKDGATTGKTCFIDETFPFREAVVNEHVFICRTNQDQIQSLFLFYWLWGPQGQYEIKSSFQGAAIGGINQGFVDSVSIPLPALPEQHRMAAVLREQMATVEKARTAAQARLAAVKALPAAFLRKVFPQHGQPLPDGWRWVKLGEVCRDISDGTHFTPTYVFEGVPFLSVKDVREERLSFIDCRYITKEQHHDFCRRCKPEKGDVLYTKVGTTGIAKAINIDVDFSIFVSVALLKLKSTIIPNYLEKVLNAPVCRTQAENLTQGMANRNLVLKDLKLIILPLPPLPEQQRIAAILREQMASVEKARSAAEEELNTINALPAALLRRAFAGEL